MLALLTDPQFAELMEVVKTTVGIAAFLIFLYIISKWG